MTSRVQPCHDKNINHTITKNMALNYIWIAFFIIAFIVALIRLIWQGDAEVFPAIMDSTFEQAKTAFEISIGLTGVLSLWMGIMRIGERGGLIAFMSRMLSPILTRIFPDNKISFSKDSGRFV